MTSTLLSSSSPSSSLPTSSLLYPALVSSVIENCITHPIDVIKIHKQTNMPLTYNFKTLYKGFSPRAIGNIPSRTVFLFTQDYLQTACYGAIGGLLGSYISHPLDTIKTCIQTNRNYDYFKAKEYMRGGHLRAGMSMINIFISLYVFERMKNL